MSSPHTELITTPLLLMTTTLEQRFDALTPHLILDDVQRQVVGHLDKLTLQIMRWQLRYDRILLAKATLLGRIRLRLKPRKVKEPRYGIYLWGGVGRGKTLLMDAFYQYLPIASKQRIHFHQFMRTVHEQLQLLQGEPDPLRRVALWIRNRGWVLCLDEFIVNDIGDAMILAGLLEAMNQLGVVLITTSNTPPNMLYENGLQRQKFLPAIQLIQKTTQVIELNSERDYRLRNLEFHPSFIMGNEIERHTELTQFFYHLAPIEGAHSGWSITKPGHENTTPDATTIFVNHRLIQCIKVARDVVWFDFQALCGTARSTNDYLDICSRFSTILLSNIPELSQQRPEIITRFIHLIDAIYDHGVKLVVSSTTKLDDWGVTGASAKSFQRTKSRLIEMQSEHYWQSCHRPGS
ncbi:MAG: cell division protein ZapE [Pseudomonadota bacterium]